MVDDDGDDFEGIDINGPWGGVRIGSGRIRDDFGGDPEYRRARRAVRRRLDFLRHLATYVFIVGGFAIIDGLTGGGWWVQYLAAIWGGILALQLFTTFIAPRLWGRDVEERMVRHELERNRGRVTVTKPTERPPE